MLDKPIEIGYTFSKMIRQAVAMTLPIYFWASLSFSEEGTELGSSARTESFHADWTVFGSKASSISFPTPLLTPEEIQVKKRELSFKAAETVQEMTDSLGIPFVPRIIEQGSEIARGVYQLKQVANERHIHLDVSRSSSKVKFRFKF